jgi:dynein heavy chain
MKTLCILFGVPGEKVKQTSAKDAVTYDYWEPAKKKLLVGDLLKKCKDHDRDNMNPDTIEKLKPLISAPDYTDEVLKNASKAAHGLAKWVRAMVQYFEAMKVVNPKREQLKIAQ